MTGPRYELDDDPGCLSPAEEALLERLKMEFAMQLQRATRNAYEAGLHAGQEAQQ